jgi:hypothetical protein
VREDGEPSLNGVRTYRAHGVLHNKGLALIRTGFVRPLAAAHYRVRTSVPEHICSVSST